VGVGAVSDACCAVARERGDAHMLAKAKSGAWPAIFGKAVFHVNVSSRRALSHFWSQTRELQSQTRAECDGQALQTRAQAECVRVEAECGGQQMVLVSKVALLVAYDGTPYRGWTDVRDTALRPTLARILRADVTLDAASRTDAGVHALGQVG
jgi:hypothetical protein